MNSEHTHSLVTVFIPVFNAGDFLRLSLLSIINQTYKNLEIIVIDDGSTDDCISSIADISDCRLHVLRKKNGGKASALNMGMKQMHGEFWLIQDADDLSYPERVQKQYEALQNHPNLAAVYIGTDLIFKNKRFAPVYPRKDSAQCKSEIESFKLPAHDATGMYRTSMTSGLFFNEDLRVGQGVDYVWRVGELFPILVLDECLYSHRVNYQSITHQNPDDNYRKINIVIQNACQRRGVDFKKYKVHGQSPSLKQRRGIDSVLPYAIESVVTLKRRKAYIHAIKTSWFCITIHPLDWMYYKPVIYLFVPEVILEIYRDWKAKR